jgi:acid phosphatase family membrane protein YuiD
LREVIGHTPLEVVGGILLGLVVGTVNWLIWI